MNTQAIDFNSRLEELITLLKAPKVPTEKALWDSEMCAAYLGVKQKYFLSNIAAIKSFPRARNVSGSERSQGHRWVAGEVMNWAMSKKVA